MFSGVNHTCRRGAIARGFSTVYVNVEVEGYVAVPQCSLSDADWLFRFFHVLVCIICYSCYFFLWSNKVTTKISELKRKDLENAKIFVSVYSADIRVSFSFSLRIVSGFFPCGFSTSLSDAETREYGGEDGGGGDGAGYGG